MPDAQDATDRLKQTYAVLVGDCQEVEQLLRTTDTPCLRRAFVRVLSAFVEGMAFQMRCVVRDALQEFPAAADKCGFLDWETNWLRTGKLPKTEEGKRFHTALTCYAKLYAETFVLKCGDNVGRLVTIRNRITHPQSAPELEVSDNDFIEVGAAAEALIDDMGRLFIICNAKG